MLALLVAGASASTFSSENALPRMDWQLIKICIALLPVAALLLLPLLLIPKLSRFYIPVWTAYGLLAAGVIVSAISSMLQLQASSSSTTGSGFSPIGDATIGRVIHGAGFLVSIPMFLYLATFGLPWLNRKRRKN